MKRILAFLVLVSHMNFSMFIPQLDEADQYDANGNQLEDINTLAQYVSYVVLGHTSTSHQDDDDDCARYFHIVKTGDHFFCNRFIELRRPAFTLSQKTKYPASLEQKLPSLFFDIQSPPPKA